MNEKSKPLLQGNRIVLRPLTASDAGAMYASLEEPTSRRLTGTHAEYTLEEVRAHCARIENAGTPATANNILRTLSSMMSWCVPRGWRDNNPCTNVKKLKGSIGYAPWSWEEIEHFRRHARRDLWRAAALALYTGQWQADVLDMRWSDVKEGLIAVVQSKTGKKLWIPMHAQLRIVLADMPQESVYMLTNTKHLPWTVDGFKTSWCHELKRSAMEVGRGNRRVFHGLRKSAVVFLLEAGCTDAEVSSITGQSRQMVEHYARQVNQKKLAASAVLKWEAADAVRTKNGNDRNL
jgi:integrase